MIPQRTMASGAEDPAGNDVPRRVGPTTRKVADPARRTRPADLDADPSGGTSSRRRTVGGDGSAATGEPGGNAGGRSPAEWSRPEVLASCAGALASLHQGGLSSIGVTSCIRGEGRTTIAIALAAVEHLTFGRKTILVELDLERPSVAGALELRPRPGVIEVLQGKASIRRALRWVTEDLGVMVAGGHGTGDPQLASQLLAADLLPTLEGMCEVVIVDLPPLSAPAAGQLASKLSTATLVVKAGGVSVPQIKRAVASLEVPPAVILNRVTSVKPAWLNGMLGIDQ
jgi:Mrp family chromosome partitioning ATPase